MANPTKDDRIAELELELEEAKGRVAELEQGLPVVSVDGATSNTSTPAFEDLPTDHPLKQ